MGVIGGWKTNSLERVCSRWCRELLCSGTKLLSSSCLVAAVQDIVEWVGMRVRNRF